MSYLIFNQKENQALKNDEIVFFYQNIECAKLITKVFTANWSVVPKLYKINSKMRTDIVEHNYQIAFIEIAKEDNFLSKIDLLYKTLPHELLVIIIGYNSSIITKREIEKLGFYYIYWPIKEEELFDVCNKINLERLKIYQNSCKRKTKRIAVIGAKGGVGTSLISAKLSLLLAKRYKINTLLLETTAYGSSLDFYLKIKNFTPHIIKKLDLESDFNSDIATKLVTTIIPQLSLLSLNSRDLKQEDLFLIVNKIIEQLSLKYNYLLTDYSATNSFYANQKQIIENNTVLIVVMDPSIVSMRRVQVILDINRQFGYEREIFIIVNHVMTSSPAITIAEIKKYLDIKKQYIVEIKHIGTLLNQSDMQVQLNKLLAEILGYSTKTRTENLFFRIGKFLRNL